MNVMCSSSNPSIVKMLLSNPALKLDTAESVLGDTALHLVCVSDLRPFLIPLVAQDKRCTSAVLNKRNDRGETPLMAAVTSRSLECVKELGKLEGTNFRTVNNEGKTLLDVARNDDDDEENETADLIKYLLEKKTKETLEEKAAYHVATLINNIEDVEKLEIPLTVHSLVKKFLLY